MRRLRIAAVMTIATLAAGCGDLLSVHALYTAEDRVTDPAIEGLWQSDEDRLIVSRDDDGYRAMLQNKKTPTDAKNYDVRLVDIAGVRFADLLEEETIGHMIVRVRVVNGQLRFAFMDSKWLRDRVAHEEAVVGPQRTRAILTMRTPELREMVARYAKEPRAFDEETVFHR